MPPPLTGWGEVISMRLELKGFIVFDAWQKRIEIFETLQRAVKDGKIRVSQTLHILLRNLVEQFSLGRRRKRDCGRSKI